MATPPGRRLSDAPALAHVALLAVIIVVAIVIGGWREVASSDEGAYLVQARQLDAGGWAIPYPYRSDDASYRFGPYFSSEVTDTGVYLFGPRPAYPGMLAVAYRVGGVLLIRAMTVAGALLAALAAWFLARRLAPGREALAFWVAGIGPLLAEGTMIWAHSLSAAAAGGTALAALRSRERSTAVSLGALGVCAVAGSLLRTEGTIIAGAIGLAAVVVLPRARGLLIGGVALTGGLVGLAFQRLLWRSIKSGTSIVVEATTTADRVHRLGGAVWRDVLSGGYLEHGAEVVGFLAPVCLALGVVLHRRGRPSGDAMFVAGVALLAARVVIAPGDVATGLIAGWPIILLVIFGIRWSAASESVRFLGVAAVAFGTVVIATDYQDGGGFQWAGRYFSPLIVPVAALSVVALPALSERLAGRWSAGARRAAIGVVVALPAVLTVTSTVHIRRMNGDLVDAARLVDAPVIVSTIPSLPRLAWDDYPHVDYLLARSDADLAPALRIAATGSPPVIGLVGAVTPPDLRGYTRAPVGGEPRLWRFTRVAP